MTGFVLARVRAHRLLLAAALIAVVLTTTVLSTLAAFSGGIGDAALRHSLRTRDTAETALLARAEVGTPERKTAESAVRDAARTAFDGLPVTVTDLVRSGPYSLPRSLQPPAARAGNPYLTQFAALDPAQVRVTDGRLPRPSARGRVEVALPETAAAELGVRPGARNSALTLGDRRDGPAVRIRIVGVYRPVATGAAYWQLDPLRGRGAQKVSFATYGPLLTDRSVLTAEGRVSRGETAWLATGDFSAMTIERIGALRDAAREGTAALRGSAALAGSDEVSTGLPGVLDRAERAMLVSRSTLLIVALQLCLLAGYTLLLVARLLSSERAGETGLMRARGASRGRIASLAALEALLLAVPAALLAPLLAGPLTGLLTGQGALSRIGLRVDAEASGMVWLVAATVALGCALAVTLPALGSATPAGPPRARALPGPLRAGADLALLVVAGVAYWQLDQQTSGSGALSGDRTGRLGIDPLLVTAPALALLAGTVLTLRLLPPVARLAERRAASGRGLTSALAGWQFSRRPLRGAGPVLLLVLSVAMGMLAIGQGASWDRSQDDQADFRAGAPIRVLTSGAAQLGQAGRYEDTPGIEGAAPALRTSMQLSGGREATVLALDMARGAGSTLIREDLGNLTKDLKRDTGTGPQGTPIPEGTGELALDMRLRSVAGPGEVPEGGEPDGPPKVSVVLEDRYGVTYRLPGGNLPADGDRHRIALDLTGAAAVSDGRAAEPLTLVGLELGVQQPVGREEQHTLTLEGLRATAAEGRDGPRDIALGADWLGAKETAGEETVSGPEQRAGTPLDKKPGGGLAMTYPTGQTHVEADGWFPMPAEITVRLIADRPAPTEFTAIATDRFLEVLGARTGDRVEVPVNGVNLPVRITGSVRALPTTAPDTRSAALTDIDGSVTEAGASSVAERDGGALLMDLAAVNRMFVQKTGAGPAPNEWWLTTGPGRSAEAASALRSRSDADPASVIVRDEIADALRDDPLGAGPGSALTAVALTAAALAAVGFGVSTAGALRERAAEFAVLRALGTPRRRLARLVAAEQGILVTVALLVGVALGTVLTRAVVPLIVLTPGATQPVPQVLVELPPGQVALLLALVALGPLLITAALPLRGPTRLASALGEVVER
ncbi:FtsX-like permease family protein [Streptomyces uncialis]|uniref:FtsX-like permease family protein n=1 Tax=Streptomyces uncialis TaxID=1048205 RepID=UPI0037BCCBA4